MPRNRIRASGVVLAGLVSCALALSGCSKDTAKPKTDSAGDKVDQANAALEDILFRLASTDPALPSDIDFRTPEQKYREALVIDPTNEDANFGAGVLGLLVLTSDPEVNAAFDEWKTYLESHTPFEVGGGALQPLGISIAPTGDRAALALPFQAVPFSLLAESRTALAGADPQIGRVQAILSERALPRLTEAIARLQVVGRDPSYRFIVSPRMQGDTRAHPIEIDQTDILALHAGAELLSSIVHAAVAYELGFAAYDSASLVHALTPGSGWLALRAGGAEHLRAAGADLRASIDGVEETIDALLAETDDPTDDQSDDLIKVGNGRADVESLKVHLPQARAALTTGYAFVGDWDRDPGTPKTSLRIKAGALFDTPIPDWKALLPAYTVSTVRRSRRIQYVSQYGATHDTVSVLRADFYHGYYSYSYSGGSGSEFYDGDPQVRAPLRRVILGLLHEAEQQRGWNGTFFGTGNFADSLPSVVTTTIEVSWFQEYTLAPSQVVVPVITWDAPTFAEWHWPDPTLGGLLPELDDPNQLDAMFGIDAGNWTRERVLDWTQGPPIGGSLRAARARGAVATMSRRRSATPTIERVTLPYRAAGTLR
jgi:hypothetical protein